MAKNKKKPEAAPKRFFVQLSWPEALGWLGVLVLICGWFFIWGLLVGRGLVPLPADSGENLAGELQTARQKALAKRVEKSRSQPAMDYHEALRQDPRADAPIHPVAGQDPAATKKAKKYKIMKPSAGEDPATATATARTEPQQARRRPAKTAESSPDNLYAVQIAALRSAKTARELIKELAKMDCSAYMVKATLPSNQIWYRVRSGRFDSRKTAAPLLNRLKQEGYDPILVKNH